MDAIKSHLIGQCGCMPTQAEDVTALLRSEPDIADEFKWWIQHRRYPRTDPLRISGYSARDISILSPSLRGAGAYCFLVFLRQDQDEARKIMDAGFPKKRFKKLLDDETSAIWRTICQLS